MEELARRRGPPGRRHRRGPPAGGHGPSTAAGTAPAAAQGVDDIVAAGEVRIGVLTGAPPFGTIDERGNPAGYDVDVANLVAEYLGVTAEARAADAAGPHPGARGRQGRLPRGHAGADAGAGAHRDVHHALQRLSHGDRGAEGDRHRQASTSSPASASASTAAPARRRRSPRSRSPTWRSSASRTTRPSPRR